MTKLVPTALSDVIEVHPMRHGDDRGWFSEVFRPDHLADGGITSGFVQDNESFSAPAGTLRGIHYQIDPHPQAKLMRIVRGSVLDVVVDLRRSSPTFRHHVAVTLSAEIGNQLFIPEGFGHGFITLEPDVHVIYKVSDRYAPDAERSVRWNDPDLAIEWPAEFASPTLSAKDLVAPFLADQPDLFN